MVLILPRVYQVGSVLHKQRQGHGFETRWGHLMSYRYQSITRILFKSRWQLKDIVEDHHVIPRHLQHHKVLRELAFDINASKNLVMMPTKLGMRTIPGLRQDRLVHGDGHKEYNRFVKHVLDSLSSPCEFWNFHDFLKRNCRNNIDRIPW